MNINVKDLYEMMEYLIKTSRQGYIEMEDGFGTACQCGSVGGILSLGARKDLGFKYAKEIGVLIDSLSKQKDLPTFFFEKPFYYPFNEVQLERLKEQCREIEHKEASRIDLGEQKTIALYEKILDIQQKKIGEILPNLNQNFSLVLSARKKILHEAMTKIDKQIADLEKREKNPRFFDNRINAEVKISRLTGLRISLKNIHDDYDDMGKVDLDWIKCCEYLETTEAAIFTAVKNARKQCSELKEHNNPIMNFLDAILRTITLGFGHISTKTEAVIAETRSSINNKF